MTHVSGTNHAPDVMISHLEPPTPIAAGILAAGKLVTVDVGDYVNKSNVPQNFSPSVSNLVSCTLNKLNVTNTLGAIVTTFPLVLQPEDKAHVSVDITPTDHAPGTPDQTTSFDIDPGWS